MAEAVGFEPTKDRITTLNRLSVCLYKPLRHTSVIFIIVLLFYGLACGVFSNLKRANKACSGLGGMHASQRESSLLVLSCLVSWLSAKPLTQTVKWRHTTNKITILFA